MMRYLYTAVLLMVLAGCGGAPPVPTDYFYRLTLPAEGIAKTRITEQVIHVGVFFAEGLYNERALLYASDPQGRELQQHHYHFWITSPPHLLHDYLVDFMRAADSSPMIIADDSMDQGFKISGKVIGFEKLDNNDQSSVNIALELRLDKQGNKLPLLLKEYRVTEEVHGESLTDVVASFNAAVLRIYSEFLTDMETTL
ncbi:MAG: ABC-type transport system auxiliary component-like [Gammaproteobacteria bacterium]|nr:ABC-type transport system auxiliary component-like [Gammaproteobacteria bacterium]